MWRLLAPTLVVAAMTSLFVFVVAPATVLAVPDQLSGKVVSSVIDNPTTVITPPETPPDGTSEPSLPISGTAKPNTKIKVVNNGRVVAGGQTNNEGSFSVPTPLDMGNNKISVQTPSGAPSNQVTINRHSDSWWYRHRLVLMYSGVSFAGLAAIYWWRYKVTGHLWLIAKRRKDNEDKDESQGN